MKKHDFFLESLDFFFFFHSVTLSNGQNIVVFVGPELCCGFVSNVKRHIRFFVFFHLQPIALHQGKTADFQAWLLTVSGSKNLF